MRQTVQLKIRVIVFDVYTFNLEKLFPPIEELLTDRLNKVKTITFVAQIL